MDEYDKFFGGVDTIDVSDLMRPVLVIGGAKRKSASTVKLFSKKTVPYRRKKRTSEPSEYVESIVGSGEDSHENSICPTFTELDNAELEKEELRTMDEVLKLVGAAEESGDFSGSESEDYVSSEYNGNAEYDLSKIGSDDTSDEDLTRLDNPSSVGSAGMTLLEIDGGASSDMDGIIDLTAIDSDQEQYDLSEMNLLDNNDE